MYKLKYRKLTLNNLLTVWIFLSALYKTIALIVGFSDQDLFEVFVGWGIFFLIFTCGLIIKLRPYNIRLYDEYISVKYTVVEYKIKYDIIRDVIELKKNHVLIKSIDIQKIEIKFNKFDSIVFEAKEHDELLKELLNKTKKDLT